MFWAAFGYNIRTGLIALDGNVDSEGIYDLYASFLLITKNTRYYQMFKFIAWQHH